MMPRNWITIEYFSYIELRGPVTAEEFAHKFGLPQSQAATWLSKWAGKGYLTREKAVGRSRIVVGKKKPGAKVGEYRIGPRWWGALVYGASKDFI